MVLETTVGGIAFLAGRILFGLVLAVMGINHFMDLESMSGYAEMKGVPAPRLAVLGSGLMLLGGGVSIAVGIVPLIGGILIAIFFIGVTPVMHDFWSFDDPEERQGEMTHFLKNVTLLGGALIFIALADNTWPYALNIGL